MASFGESTIDELVEFYKEDAALSSVSLGSEVEYFSGLSGITDKFGAVIKQIPINSVSFIGGVEYSPSQERREMNGIREPVECMVTFLIADLSGVKVDKAKGRFIVNSISGTRQEYKVSSVAYVGVLNGEALHYVVGLVAP